MDRERAQECFCASIDKKVSESNNEPNKISEDIVKCLSSIFLIMSTSREKVVESDAAPTPLAFASNESNGEAEFLDPYGICSEFGSRNIGPYKHLCDIQAGLVDLNRKTNAQFLIQRQK